MQEMSEVGDPDYVQCRGGAILAEVYGHPELTPAEMDAREMAACMRARGFVLRLVPPERWTPNGVANSIRRCCSTWRTPSLSLTCPA